MMAGFREGRTLRGYHVCAARFQSYCDAHPEYAREALPLIAENKEAARLRRGERLRNLTHCKRGHPLSEARIRPYSGWTLRACRRCEHIRRSRGAIMKPEALVKVSNH